MDNSSRKKLIDAALVLFSQHGYDSVSIRQIADAANVNSALISYYFKGKAGLYQAILDTLFDFVPAFVEDVDKRHLSPKEIITEYARLMANIHQQSPSLTRIIYRELLLTSPSMVEVLRNKLSLLFATLNKAIAQGIKEGLFRRDLNAEQAVLMLAGIVNFFFIAKPISRNLIPHIESAAENYVEQSLSIFFQGIERGASS